MYTSIKQRSSGGQVAPQAVKRIAEKFGLSKKAAEVLVQRGFLEEKDAERFLHPEISQLADPMQLNGMDACAARIRQAIDNDEVVVVYGDYDADGICAAAILTKFLSEKGLHVAPYIPSRLHEGYGVTEEALTRLLEQFFPDLIITCDCGISAAAEVELVLDGGVDVIVTDHHEIPKTLPDCIVVNPKLPGQAYPYTNLCGAGVALKVVQAVDGIDAVKKYIDLAAVATIADLVELNDENRVIVKLGLEKINGIDCNLGLKTLLAGAGLSGNVTASDVAYKLAPRINAAGRMGDACRALTLMLSDNTAEIRAVASEIEADNEKRKQICADLYAQAGDLLKDFDLVENSAIVLANSDWEKGLTSIVAAQLAGEYKRPVFLMVKNGDNFKGTARSVDGVNLYSLLSACDDLLIEFGGHSQAAGFSIYEQNIDAFRVRVNQYLTKNYPPEVLLPSANFDTELSLNDVTFALAKELDRFEPFGNGNPRPVFKVTLQDPEADYMKGKPAHVVIKTQKFNINGFNFGKCCNIFRTPATFDLLIELSVNVFNGREYLSVILRDFDFKKLLPAPTGTDTEYFSLSHAGERAACPPIARTELNALVSSRRFGTLILCYRPESYLRITEQLENAELCWHSVAQRESSSNFNRIVLNPAFDFDAGGYDAVVAVDPTFPDSPLPFFTDKVAKVYVYRTADGLQADTLPLPISAERGVFVKCFSALGSSSRPSLNLIDCIKSIALTCGESFLQLYACYRVFAQLGILCYRDGIIQKASTVKKELTDSAIYRYLTEFAPR